MALTLAELLSTGDLKEARVVAGQAWLNNRVENVGAVSQAWDVDYPLCRHMLLWVRLEQVCRPVEQEELVTRAYAAGAAGVAVHIVGGKVCPLEALCRSADNLGLPVLILPLEMDFHRLAGLVLSERNLRATQLIGPLLHENFYDDVLAY
ncbi:hypothetical protein SY88_08075 [Clostridiales bacterium PH28_bin88]|nr:hypothetical protein SY88_08075 [Clostridiales bacterium PH28_bin88]